MSDLRDGLSGDLAERLERMAREDTRASLPWPGVERAVTRRRRRRIAAGVAALAVAAFVAGTLSLGGLPDRQPVRPATPPLPADLDTTTRGPLAGNAGWLAGLRERVVNELGTGSPDDVVVQWAGDVGDRRVALVVSPRGDGRDDLGLAPSWYRQAWSARRGAEPDRLEPRGGFTDMRADREDGSATGPIVAQNDLARWQSGAVLFVSDPAAATVEVGSVPAYPADGSKRRTYAALESGGPGLWVGTIDGDRLMRGTVRTTDAGGRATVFGLSYESRTDPVPDAVRVFAGVTPAGADLELVRCASGWQEGPPPGAVPVLAAGLAASRVGSTVLRAAEGGYLVGTCAGAADGGVRGDAFVAPAPAAGGTDGFSALLPIPAGQDERQLTRELLVVAPAGVAEVEVAGQRYPVTQRLAHVRLPSVVAVGDVAASAVAGDSLVPIPRAVPDYLLDDPRPEMG